MCSHRTGDRNEVENGAPTASSAHPENGLHQQIPVSQSLDLGAVSPSRIGMIGGTGGSMSRSGLGSTVGGDQRGIPGDGGGIIRDFGGPEALIFRASSCVKGL